MNLRGCGEGGHLARQMYHSGRSGDVLAVVNHLRASAPESPCSLVGFSLGGNIVLKLAGELGPAGREHIDRVIAVCPPVDLAASSRRMSTRSGTMYERYFCKLLHAAVRQRHERFPDLPRPQLPRRFSLREFDNRYTAPQAGFIDAADYYTRSSALPVLGSIAVPCRILFSRDDPLVDVSSLEDANLPANVQLHPTTKGGHLGFLARPWSESGYYWMDSLLVEWLAGTTESALSHGQSHDSAHGQAHDSAHEEAP